MVSQTVTTAWCTELGTTLLNGFTNTTDNPAYFRCLNSFSVRQQLGPRQFLPTWSRHAGATLLRNTLSASESRHGQELKAQGFSLVSQYGFPSPLCLLFATGEHGFVKGLVRGEQMKDNPSQLVRRRSYGLWGA